MCVPDRAPRQARHGWVGRVELAAKVGDVVRNVPRAFDRILVDAVLDDRFEGRALEDRLSDDTIGPRHDFAATYGAAQAMQEKRPEVSATDMVLPCPHQLHGPSWPNRLASLSNLTRHIPL